MNEFAYQEKHMGVEVIISLITDLEEHADEIKEEAFAQIRLYEERFSRFLPGNELARLNVSKDMVVSEDFFSIIELCHDLHLKTAGGFNPLFQIARYGYDRDFATLPDITELVVDPSQYDTDFTAVVLDRNTCRVTLREGQQIDLGGILKGYVADKLSCNISGKYPHCIGNIINIGGDLHTEGMDSEGKPFEFSILNPITKSETPVLLTGTSLATSGTYKRVWQTKEGPQHHILGNKKMCAEDVSICSASVIHRDGAIADACTKLFLTRETKEAVAVAEDCDLTYLLVATDGEIISNIS